MFEKSNITGGLGMLFDGDDVEITGSGKMIHMLDEASILYSSDLVANAKGLESTDNGSYTFETVYYRVQ